jgi:hypothetical protein
MVWSEWEWRIRVVTNCQRKKPLFKKKVILGKKYAKTAPTHKKRGVWSSRNSHPLHTNYELLTPIKPWLMVMSSLMIYQVISHQPYWSIFLSEGGIVQYI